MVTRCLGGVWVDDLGEGEPLVVFPGGPARHADYLERLGGLDAHRRLIIVHPRGTGASPEPADPARYSAQRQADDLETVRQHLGLDALTLAAHSAGAVAAVVYATRHPRRLDRLVLVTPATTAIGLRQSQAESDAQRAQHASQPWFDEVSAAVEEAAAAGDGDARRAALMPLLYGEWTERAQAHAALDPQQSNAEARRQYLSAALDAEQLKTDFAAVTCPVRIIIGERDLGPGPEVAARLAGLFTDGAVLTQPGAGHFPWVDDPAAFRSLMLEALA